MLIFNDKIYCNSYIKSVLLGHGENRGYEEKLRCASCIFDFL